MERRTLGNTGLEISKLGYGAASLGNIYRDIDESEGTRSVHAAIDAGINYFDVAPLYGFTLAEKRLGEALEGRRDDVIIATKCCRDKFDVFDFSAERVAASMDESLSRLKTDYIDVFQIHDVEFGTFEQVVNETIPAAMKLKESGKARFVGITGLPVRYLRKVTEATGQFDTLLSWGHCTLIEDEMETELAELCREKGIGLMTCSPLLQGLLTDNPPPEWHRSPDVVKAGVNELAAVCKEYNTDLATVALKYAVDNPHVATNVVGMSTASKVARNVKALETTTNAELLDRLLEIAQPIKNMMWFEGNPDNNIPPSDPNQYVPQSPAQTHE